MDTFLQPSANIRGSLLINAASLQKPEMISVYSSNKVSKTLTEIQLDASNCKYFRKDLLSKQIDLKVYEEQRKDYENKHKEYAPHRKPMVLFLECLEQFIMQDKFIKCNANKLFDADIICHAKVLIKMMMVHGDFNENFSLLCTKYKGNIYITK